MYLIMKSIFNWFLIWFLKLEIWITIIIMCQTKIRDKKNKLRASYYWCKTQFSLFYLDYMYWYWRINYTLMKKRKHTWKKRNNQFWKLKKKWGENFWNWKLKKKYVYLFIAHLAYIYSNIWSKHELNMDFN